MEHKGVVITAGYNKSMYALAVAELLKGQEVPIKGFIVVSPYSLKRVKKYFRQRGFSFLKKALSILLARNTKKPDRNLLEKFLKENSIYCRTINKWARLNGADYISTKSLNESSNIAYLKKADFQWLVYCGGGIIKSNLIQAVGGRILNAHQGPLPEIRGMNAAEWGILLNQRQESTIHLVDRGIDTGTIIKRVPYSIDSGGKIESVRDIAKIKSIMGLVEVASSKNLDKYKLVENNDNYRQCFVLSPVTRALLQNKLDYLSAKGVLK